MARCFSDVSIEERRAEFKNRGLELSRLIKFSLEEKIKLSIEKIKQEIESHSNPLISCSWGKDSVALLHMIRKIDKNIPVLYIDTGIEFPENRGYMELIQKEWNLKIYTVTPKQTFWEIVEKWGYPPEARESNKTGYRKPRCCKILKMDPYRDFLKKNNFDLVFVGLTSGEGRQRRMPYLITGDVTYYNKSEGVDKCIPLLWWLPNDVFEYFKLENIPLNPCYEKYNITRIGCIACTGHKKWREQMSRIFPKLYNKISEDMALQLRDEDTI